MSVQRLSVEPFPTFVDSIDVEKFNHFSGMGRLQLLGPSGAKLLRKRQDSITAKFTNYINLHYYQYEVTMGLYVMTPMEKIICNTIIFGILAAVAFGLYYGLQPFLIRSICRVLYYVYGSIAGVEDICAGAACS